MTKPNNSWEIEFDNILGNRKDIIDQLVGRIPDEKVIEGLKYFDETRRQLTELFSKTLQQQREELLDNKKVEEIMMKIFKERKAELDVIKFKSNTRAFAVAGIDLIYNYMLEVIKLLQSLKQENK